MEIWKIFLILVVFVWLFRSSVSIEKLKQATEGLAGERYIDKTNKEVEKLKKEVYYLRQELKELQDKIETNEDVEVLQRKVYSLWKWLKELQDKIK